MCLSTSLVGDNPSLYLKDQDGNVRLLLGGDSSESSIKLYSRLGENRARFYAGDEEAALSIYGKNGKPDICTSLVDGNPVLSLRDKDGNLFLKLGGEAGASLSLNDRNSKAFLELDVEFGDPEVELYDEYGKIRARLGCSRFDWDNHVKEQPSPSLRFFKEGKVLWSAP